jgi:DNA-binding NarL/FixJ family response regulator
LTARELEALRCIADGVGNSVIAERLTITEGTVKTHVNSILTNLQITNRTQAAVLAWHEGSSTPQPRDGLDDRVGTDIDECLDVFVTTV